MLNRVQPIQKSTIYIVKKNKEPDHLFSLIEKNKNREQMSMMTGDEEFKDRIKKHILQKRIDSIMKNGQSKSRVSEPVPFVKKKWISPLAQLHQNESSEQQIQKKHQQVVVKPEHQEQVQRVVKILDLNNKLKYFGQYLQVSYQRSQITRIGRLAQRNSKVEYLSKKFYELEKQLKPRLCIMNFAAQQKVNFVNYLQQDKWFQEVIRKDDDELVKMLIEALEINARFTITSYLNFYDIFVWQTATKEEQIQFVCKLMMKESKQKSIVQIGNVIDLICCKIQIQQFNKSLENFNEVMKKLLFGDDFENAQRKEYYLTRKAMMESLERNEECVSIFINIFYTC